MDCLGPLEKSPETHYFTVRLSSIVSENHPVRSYPPASPTAQQDHVFCSKDTLSPLDTTSPTWHLLTTALLSLLLPSHGNPLLRSHLPSGLSVFSPPISLAIHFPLSPNLISALRLAKSPDPIHCWCQEGEQQRTESADPGSKLSYLIVGGDRGGGRGII